MFYEGPFHSLCWGLRGISLPLLDEFEGDGYPYTPYLVAVLCHKAFCIFAGQEKSLFSRRITSQQQAEATCPARSPKI